MGAGIWPVFKPNVPGLTPHLDGTLLLNEFERLDGLAAQLGVPPFSSFGDTRGVPQGFDGSPDELEEIMGPWDEWFAPNDGILTFSALANAMDNPSIAETFPYAEGLQDELRELLRCLDLAAAANSTFRLEVLG